MTSSDFVGDAKSIILVGFAGSDFWKVFHRFLDNNPDFKEKYEDPIDSYSRLTFGRLSGILRAEDGIRYKSVFPFGRGALDIDFVKLGALGGVGVPSPSGDIAQPGVRHLVFYEGCSCYQSRI